MASFNGLRLTNPIRTDVPDTQEVLVALAKQDPTSIADIPVGAKRLYEVSSDKWQWQEYSGSSWVAVPFLQHNVDQLDGYHAAITPAANTVAVRNASGVLEDSITGNAATASSAATLSQTLPVNKGGTGATTSAAARTNLGVPPTSHASTATTYGVANASQYGHVKLSDAANSSSGVSGGVAATPAAVKAAKDAADAAQSSADAAQSSADAAQSSADAAMTKASTLATSSTPGIVKPGIGMTVDAEGTLDVNTASTSKAGIVKLDNTVTSTSTTECATANAVKTAYDKAVEAQKAADAAGGKNVKSYVIETWKSGQSWYRKYSDGFIEQGGFISIDSPSEVTTTFFVPFTILPHISLGGVTNAGGTTYDYQRHPLALKTSYFKTHRLFTGNTAVNRGAYWFACGY